MNSPLDSNPSQPAPSGGGGAWHQALDHSKALLSDAERERYGKSGPDDILRDFQAVQSAQAQASKVQRLLNKLQPVVTAIERYGQPLDVVANISPEFLSPAWGILRAVLLVARDFEGYFSKLMGMLRQIGDAMPGLQIYEQLFCKHKSLRDALSALYLEFITFLVKAKRIFSSSSFKLFARVLWKPFDQTFHKSLVQLKRHGDLVEREARLAHMVEESEARLELARVRSLVEEQVSQQAPGLLEIKHWLNARTCEDDRDGLEVEALPATCEWILERPELSAWISQEQIQLFWLSGPPGCGKSFLYGKLLGHLEKEGPVIYFMFCGADNNRMTVSAILRSWTYQLCRLFPEATKGAVSTRQASENRQATAREVQGLFFSLLHLVPACFLAVDAADECSDRLQLYQVLRQIPKRFKVLLTSRPLPDLSNHLLHNNVDRQACLEITADMIQHDIDLYIAHKLTEDNCTYEEQLKARIQQRLGQCGSMFLWVRLMVEHIREQTSEDEILHCLQELPKSLSERYDGIMAGINSLPKPRRLLAYKVFFWMVVARRPLEVKELCALLAVRPSCGRADGFDPGRRVRDPESTIVTVCGSLVAARGRRRTLYPIHFTVTEYLKAKVEHDDVLTELTAFYEVEQLRSSDSLVAAVCLRYLSLSLVAEALDGKVPSSSSDIDTLLTSGPDCLDAVLYAATNWFDHLERVETPESPLLALADELLDPKYPNMEMAWRLYWFAGADSAESTVCPGSFSPVHIAVYFGLYHLLCYLLPKHNPEALDERGRSALWWAANRGHVLPARALLKAGVRPDQPDMYSITPAHRAAAVGILQVYKEFVTAPVQCYEIITDADGWTPLHWAAARGHGSIVGLTTAAEEAYIHNVNYQISPSLADLSAYGSRDSLNNLGRTPLHLAALNGHDQTVCGLGRQNALHPDYINTTDSNGQTALHLAAISGHLGAVEFLVWLGADMNILDQAGKTAAQKASEMGNEAIFLALAELRSSCGDSRALMTSQRLAKVADNFTTHDFQLLDKTKFLVNSRDGQDASLIHTVLNAHNWFLDSLLMKSRRLDFRDERGRTLLHHAALLGNERCAQRILGVAEPEPDFVADFLDTRDDRGWTALHYAVIGQFDAIVKMILEAGASASLKNNDGASAYDSALKQDHGPTVEVFARYGRLPAARLSEAFAWNEAHCRAHDGTLTADEVAAMSKAVLAERDRFGRLPMHRALETRNWEAARLLRDSVDPIVAELVDMAMIVDDTEDPDGYNLRHEFLDKLQPSSLSGAGDDTRGHAQRLLVSAAKRNDVQSITTLLWAGAHVDARDRSTGHYRSPPTALQVAISKGSFDAVVELLKRDACLQLPDSDGYFPIHTACLARNPELVGVLLEHGADPNQATVKDGETPLAVLLRIFTLSPEESLKIANLLLDRGGSLHPAQSPPHTSAIRSVMGQFLSRCSDEARARYQQAIGVVSLAGLGALVQLPTKDGLAPIHIAAMNGDTEAVKGELDAGVPVDWKSFAYPKRWPLQIAMERCDPDMVALLLEYGADTELWTDWSHGRAKPEHSEEVMALLEAARKRRKL